MSGIVVLGGGFAGLSAALNAAGEVVAAGASTSVTLISRDPFLTIRPRLYERDPRALRVPLAPVLGPVGVELVEGEIDIVDVDGRRVVLAGGSERRYDRLVLATGSRLAALPVPGRDEHAFDIDTYDTAVAFDDHLARVLEEPEAPGHLTFALLGAGMCGIELACELRPRIAARAGEALAARARVVLVERGARPGAGFGAQAGRTIADALVRAGVELRTGRTAARIAAGSLELDDGERIEAATTVVTAGMRASALAAAIPGERDGQGRLHVDETLAVPGASGVFACGDSAHARVDADHHALMSCQHARTMGKYAGHNAARDLLGLPRRAYVQPGYVTCLDLGACGALFTEGWERRVTLTGDQAKQRKRTINTQLIYPPSGDRDQILAAGRIDEATGR